MEQSNEQHTIDTLSNQEAQVIEMLRSQNFQSLKITKRNGRIDMIERTERIEERIRIVDILKEHNYQNIELKQNDGRVVYINRTIKTKVK